MGSSRSCVVYKGDIHIGFPRCLFVLLERCCSESIQKCTFSSA